MFILSAKTGRNKFIYETGTQKYILRHIPISNFLYEISAFVVSLFVPIYVDKSSQAQNTISNNLRVR